MTNACISHNLHVSMLVPGREHQRKIMYLSGCSQGSSELGTQMREREDRAKGRAGSCPG